MQTEFTEKEWLERIHKKLTGINAKLGWLLAIIVIGGIIAALTYGGAS